MGFKIPIDPPQSPLKRGKKIIEDLFPPFVRGVRGDLNLET